MMLKLANAQQWSGKVVEYAEALSESQEEVLRLRKRVQDLEELCEQRGKIIHVLQQRCRRQGKRKIDHSPTHESKRTKVIKVIEASTQTYFLPLEPITQAETLLQEISERLIDPKKHYSDVLKNFSFEIHYKSPSAYEHLREKLDKALPHPCNFNRWTKHVSSDPGKQIHEATAGLNLKHSIYFNQC